MTERELTCRSRERLAPPPDWYTRLARALDAHDPAEARVQARALLNEIGEEVRHVSERERTHQLLRESESRFRALARAAFDFTVFTRAGVIIAVDGDADAVLGVGSAAIIGRSVLDFAAPSAQPLVQQRIQCGDLGSYEAVAMHAKGEAVPSSAS